MRVLVLFVALISLATIGCQRDSPAPTQQEDVSNEIDNSNASETYYVVIEKRYIPPTVGWSKEHRRPSYMIGIYQLKLRKFQEGKEEWTDMWVSVGKDDFDRYFLGDHYDMPTSKLN